ncbi:MAG TPA: glutamate-1-semialdehyde 2,1-aminomutase [Polyangia bacterium]|nr:glutamate-1-semialdehyde 2,1-aminomutase [Polyangia bacterium]
MSEAKNDKSSRPKSHALFEAGKRVIPGGVNSPVRAFRGVGGDPVFFARGKGAYVWDVDGNEYVDYVGSWGPLIAGHAHPEILEAIAEAAANGTSFGAPTEREVQLAAELISAVPSMEMVRLCSSGTEATMAALRVARGFTKRDKIIKIDGGYHGASDCLLVAAGSGAATLGIPGSGGVTAGTAADTLTVGWNDEPAMRALFDANPGQIAAVIVEPVCGNMGCVPPKAGYLQALRKLTQQHGTVLIFDEVMTGFRVSYGGAQAYYGVEPDMTTLGKIVGGGLPVGAYGGKRDIMSVIAPLGPVYQAGTLSGNPLAVAAGMKMLEIMRRPGAYEQLGKTTQTLVEGLGALAKEFGIPTHTNAVGSMFTSFFASEPVFDYASAKKSDTARFGRFFHTMLDHGVYLAPSQFEAAFVSTAHDARAIERTLEAARHAFAAL